jgi:hypothetical protein
VGCFTGSSGVERHGVEVGLSVLDHKLVGEELQGVGVAVMRSG